MVFFEQNVPTLCEDQVNWELHEKETDHMQSYMIGVVISEFQECDLKAFSSTPRQPFE